MTRQYWLMKSEPQSYSWEDLLRDGSTLWDGVRSHSAKRNLAAMHQGDQALFYHSNVGRACVGIVEISATAIPDPTAPDGATWVAVRVVPIRPLANRVTLSMIKAEPRLAAMELIRQSRLSVAPVRETEWHMILNMATREG